MDLDSPSQLKESDPMTACPDCGWKITNDFHWCPQCGVRIKPIQCTFCSGWVPQGMDSCPRCGAPA
ncbi:MAG: zinc ribbon domain-containing protein [Brevefilum sp.]|nr:zinc ribbon domain-containing protein [Brevefilum sp.]